MFDGYLVLLPIQGAIVAAVFMIIGITKVFRGASGTDAIKWNAITRNACALSHNR
jgi:hypothetical protein